MRKTLLLISVLVFAFTANAAVININTETSDALRNALANAADGDEIVMAAGIYEESNSNYIAFNAKNVTVKAADGANVIIKPHVPFTVSGGARAEIQGVKIDASELCTLGSYSHLMYASDNADNNRLILDGCEIYGYNVGKAVIACRSSYKLDSLIINNCKFYNHTTRSCVFLENTENKGLIITNSTFYNIATGTESFSAGIIDDRSTTAKVRVDHCTFYNVVAQNTDYAAVGKITISDGIVSNSIFMLPTNTDGERAIRGVAAANNCLTYNYIKDDNWGIHSSTVKNSNCIKEQDPLFANAASGDFTLANNWVTMNISPAIGAATDGSDLGDPRWHTAGTLPSTNFASPYVLTGDKAKLTGKVTTDASNYLQFSNNSDASQHGVAIWMVRATRSCYLQATLNIDAENTSGHRYQIEVFDSSNTLVGTAIGESANSWDKGDKVISDLIMLSEAGDYKVRLSNLCDNSSNLLHSITLSYIGGAVQNMPGTTDINDAWFSSNGTREDGKISIPSGHQHEGWVKWNVSFADAANYNVTVNIDNSNGHWYTVALYRSESDESPITVSEGAQKGTIGTLELGAMEVPAGNYILKVTNATQYSDAKLISVNFAYAGGAAIDLSKDAAAELLPDADAILSDDWTIEEGKISYDESKATTGYAKWNVNSADYGNYKVTVNISSDNGHGMRVEVFEDEAQPAIYTLDEPSSGKYGTGDLALDLGNIILSDREYVVKITNTVSSSHAKIASIVIAYTGGAFVNLPATLPLADAILSTNAYVDGDGLHFSDEAHKSHVDQEWAKWNIHADGGAFTFTFNVNGSDYGLYSISILDAENRVVLSKSHGISSSGSYTTDVVYLDGNYTVQMQNINNYSLGYLTSISAASVSDILVLDEMEESMDVITANDGQSKSVAIKRTFRTGVYNSICLPFNVSSGSELTKIFGEGYELLEMNSATLDEGVLTLNFVTPTSGIYHGTPYLIKPTKDVVNPLFTHTISAGTSHLVVNGGDANLVGVLYKQDLGAHPENLYLGADGKLYFSNNDVTIYGFRAYFHVNVSNPQQVIKHARIVTSGQVATYIDLVGNDEVKDAVKTIENGQLIIIRDGIRYNVCGQRIE